MMTSSNGNIFRITGLLCGEFTGHRWIPPTKASDAELWYVFLSVPKQSWGWWFETPSPSLWRHCNDLCAYFHFLVEKMRGEYYEGLVYRWPSRTGPASARCCHQSVAAGGLASNGTKTYVATTLSIMNIMSMTSQSSNLKTVVDRATK